MANVCILDNGAYTAKVGYSTETPMIIPNCVMKAKSERRRAFIGNQIEECRDASGLFYMLCFQKGYLLNWDIQKAVWDHMFSPDGTGISLAEKSLILTEPHFNFPNIQEAMTEIFFEEYDCDAILRTTAADLSAFNYAHSIKQNSLNCIVIDMGYSFTHIVPIIKGKRIKEGIRRIDVGGKVLTNHLKELLSYRHLNVMDESYVVNQIKEDTCFVSENFNEDMKIQSKRSKENTIIKEYVLPDFTSVRRGYIKHPDDPMPEQQTIKINNERFTIPELFFHPSDVGINQMGIPECVIDCLKNCPDYTHHVLLSNIVLTGGSSQFPGMLKRLNAEIRMLAPDDIQIKITHPEDPVLYSWHGGGQLTREPDFKNYTFTKDEYEEQGVQGSLEKFNL